MIKNYEIWNKKDDLKGQKPSYWLEKHQEFNYGDVVLLKDEFGIVRYVESIITLKTNNNIDASLSTDEAMQNYFEIKELEKINEEKERLSLEEATKKISILEAENADLLLDSAIKDSKIQTLENDLADLTLEIAMMGGR